MCVAALAMSKLTTTAASVLDAALGEHLQKTLDHLFYRRENPAIECEFALQWNSKP
jgi:hypothetical protein